MFISTIFIIFVGREANHRDIDSVRIKIKMWMLDLTYWFINLQFLEISVGSMIYQANGRASRIEMESARTLVHFLAEDFKIFLRKCDLHIRSEMYLFLHQVQKILHIVVICLLQLRLKL